jgi:hypothetical protein
MNYKPEFKPTKIDKIFACIMIWAIVTALDLIIFFVFFLE